MAKRAKTIDLLRVVDLLQEHITPALCRTVFGAVRKTERQRVWTLEALIRFWTAVGVAGPEGPESSPGRLAGGAGSDVPPDRGEPRSLLSALSGSAARVLRRGLPTLHGVVRQNVVGTRLACVRVLLTGRDAETRRR